MRRMTGMGSVGGTGRAFAVALGVVLAVGGCTVQGTGPDGKGRAPVRIDVTSAPPEGQEGQETAQGAEGADGAKRTPAGDRPSSAPPARTVAPVLWRPGDSGRDVRELQARLRQVEWLVDGPTDPRCLTGRVLCVSKTSRTLRWMVDGRTVSTMPVRFGSQYTPTREGVFHVYWKSRHHVSTLYDSPMPYAMFFSGGQAVHYSYDFAVRGYAGASHGCVNVRDEAAIAELYAQVRDGDKVVVYR
ncbi:L,D-transpeptidase [Streptomyces sp. NPDC045251]|uniref:L,D-transpeptidase n=1 Tax=unclassified Streptomyces TaxID=2593676 RepID=UPI0033D2805D